LPADPSLSPANPASIGALIWIIGDASIGAIVLAGAFGELDDVGGVVDHDIHVEFHASGVHGVDERLELRIAPEMRIDLREISNPVAVVTRAFIAGRALHNLVLEDGRDPHSGDSEALDVIEPADQALKVAAVVETLGRRIETGCQPVAGQPAPVVRRIAILEPVGQQEIDHLVLRQARAIIGRRGGGALNVENRTKQQRCDALLAQLPPGGEQHRVDIDHWNSFTASPTADVTNCRWVGKLSARIR